MRSARRSTKLLVTCAVCFVANAWPLDRGWAQTSPRAAPQTAEEFQDCIKGLWPAAKARGVSRTGFDAAIDGLKPDLRIINHMDSPPEAELPVWGYLDKVASVDSIARGRDMLARHRRLFETIEKTYGIDRFTVAAIWGVETNYGADLGSWPVLQATATLACVGRRQVYFRREFVDALTIIESGDVALDRVKGAWSGAFGQTQMLPSAYRSMAVDFDRDGRADIVHSIPDALASAASYLKWHGWTSGVPWGTEVTLPGKFDFRAANKDPVPIANWSALGVTDAEGKPLVRTDWRAWLFVPAGARGPAFLVTDNFRVILRYNPSFAYALAVAALSDRLRGGPAIRHPWPRDERALTRAERLELQERLVSRGFDIHGERDGRLGIRTRWAIKRFQTLVGMANDGFPTFAVLERLRQH